MFLVLYHLGIPAPRIFPRFAQLGLSLRSRTIFSMTHNFLGSHISTSILVTLGDLWSDKLGGGSRGLIGSTNYPHFFPGH